MKQIPLLQGKVLLIELPEGATDYHVCNADGHESFSCFFIRTHTVDLPPGNWRIIGMLSEVTGEQAEELVEWVVSKTSSGTIKKYRDYRVKTVSWGLVENAIESLESAILAEGYAFTPSMSDIYDGESQCMRAIESRVLDRSRCLLLGREGL